MAILDDSLPSDAAKWKMLHDMLEAQNRAAQLLRADGTTVESTSTSEQVENDRDHE